MVKLIILSGWIISGILGLAIISAVIYLEITGKPTPEVLENWGGIIIGFYFGQLASFIKDYINENRNNA